MLTGQCTGAVKIVEAKRGAGVVAEIKFREIAVQVLFVTVLINALHSALEDGEIAFNGIGGHIAAHVFVGCMLDRFVFSKCHGAIL